MTGHRHRVRGVTLVELVIVIVITGILATMIVLFGSPIKAYHDTNMRAGLVDAADGALRRIGRDLRLALPNSVRVKTTVSGGKTVYWLEFLMLRTGGRYQSGLIGANACPSGTDAFDFTGADACFRSLGDLDVVPQINDWVVTFNLSAAETGVTNVNAYENDAITGGNKALITGVDVTTSRDRIEMVANAFPAEPPARRFHVVETPVTYQCDPDAERLTRYWGYAITHAQNTPPIGGSSSVLVDKVTACEISYNGLVIAQSAGLATLKLELTGINSSGSTEVVSLYHAIHVTNLP